MAATISSSPAMPNAFRLHPECDFGSTIPDPRSRSITPNSSGSESSPPMHHAELNSEVTTLSNKLINAINHQTNLDDSLAATRHELDIAKDYISQLEAEAERRNDHLTSGHLLYRSEVEGDLSEMRGIVDTERKQRLAMEAEKKKMEQELESLTTALFEEANQMVAAARQDRDSIERKNEQLRSQLCDMQVLLVSHQEQLSELKSVMQQMNSDRDEMESNANISTAPSTPAMASHHEHSGAKVLDALHQSPSGLSPNDVVVPSCPTSFTHLLQPILRTDLPAFEDFSALLQISRRGRPTSRVSSGTYAGGLNVMGLGNVNYTSQSGSVVIPAANGSTSSLSTAGLHSSAPPTPSTPASTVSSGSLRDVANHVPLKETRFYKRALTEDIEPTLRLDAAPGLSWLARRTVLNSMSEGNLVVEPMPVAGKYYVFSCSLCGESRKGDEFSRRHRFRVNESESAQRYPLCGYCLGRVRATCDFLGFLRMVKDGHWRSEGEEGDKGAWEETVRLRERMFWARLGGGVIPAFVTSKDSRRSSAAIEKRERHGDVVETSLAPKPPAKDGPESAAAGKSANAGGSTLDDKNRPLPPEPIEAPSSPDAATDPEPETTTGTHEPGMSKELPLAPLPVDEVETSDLDSLPLDEVKDTSAPDPLPLDAEKETSDPGETTTDAGTSETASSSGRGEQRLSITIPGAFN